MKRASSIPTGVMVAALSVAYLGCGKDSSVNLTAAGADDGGLDAATDGSEEADAATEPEATVDAASEPVAEASSDVGAEAPFDPAVCTGTTYPNDFTISSGADLTPLDAIACLKGKLEVTSNALTNLDMLASLTHIQGDLILFNANSLLNVDGLAKLNFVGGNIRIENEGSLKDLQGLANLKYFEGTSLTIKNNGGFPSCWATWLRDRLVANGWSGTEDITGNNGSGACPP